jgi:hypothetical protein
MGRVINRNTPGRKRSHLMRTIAEILRRLAQRQGEVNDEVRDMAAMIVFCLREIDDSIIDTIKAWEKRGYWKKADKFQLEWMWAGDMAERLETLIVCNDWDEMPDVMMTLFPHFADIQVKAMTRNKSMWEGCYQKLLEE